MKKLLVGSTALFGVLSFIPAAIAQTEPGPTEEASTEDEVHELDRVIVTGVFKETALEDAPVAVTALSESEIQQAAPTSAADLLKSVPGVYVNSGLGEIRNVVYSRGVSAGSNEAASGYFYVSLQEDGLPVSSVLMTNYGPDFYSRPDLMLSRLEALRGGTATITGPNAPGGIFNYISKNGRDDPGGMVEFKTGLEGDGKNPYYRGDFYYGGEIGDSGDLYYSVAGFYRESDGARDPGYSLNKGGQIRGNLVWDYGDGELTFTGKYLDDSNGFHEFLPAFNHDDPSFAPGISPTDSFLPPAAPHSWINPTGGRSDWDATRRVQSKQVALGSKWSHDFGDGWRASNVVRYQESSTDWNTGAVIFPIPITDPLIYIFSNSFGTPGTYSFRNRSDGSLAAEVVSVVGVDLTLTQNNLPNQGVLPGGVLSQVAFDPLFEVDEFMDQFQLSKTFGDHSLTLGGFYSNADIHYRANGGGIGVSGITNQPALYDIDLTLANGDVVQVTSPEGFAAHGDTYGGGNETVGTQEQYSIFFGHAWDITDRLMFDWGLRYENIEYETTNKVGVPNPSPTPGGADGDPLTLYDNFPSVQSAPLSATRDYDYVSYSTSLAYEFTDRVQAYARYSSGKKAPDFQTMIDLDTPDEISTLFIEPQEITQFEIGLKYSGDNLNLAAFPFWSELDNVTSTQLFTDENGTPYSPTPTSGKLVTTGVEIEADYQLTDTLNMRSAVTLQKSESTGFGIWVANTPVRSDDVLVSTPDGDSDNVPDILVRSTLSYEPTDRLSGFVTWNYLGDRPANRNNAFELPAYSIFDAGLSFQINDSWELRADIKNVLNEENGVLSWAPSGGLLASLDRQALTQASLQADPDQLLSILTAQPRSYFLTAAFEF
ncbi:TonB-dependent receptor [Henriciella sp. AS95]|uniref:TonB-dependent receptor n=1 Tax=Henriciella sp. AS95 TaxID=3135782 RepID=UPI00316F480A